MKNAMFFPLCFFLVTAGCYLTEAPKETAMASPQRSSSYSLAFRRAIQAHFADPTLGHDPHVLMTLGLLRERLVAEFGSEKVQDWLDHAIAEVCLVETDEGWAGAYVYQPDLPALPSCGGRPHPHFTAEVLLAMVWNNITKLRCEGLIEDRLVPRADLVQWLKRHVTVDRWSPGMETQALLAAGVPLSESWRAADGETWSVEKLLKAAIEKWRENRDRAALKQGMIVPENMLHLAPALIELFKRYPTTKGIYGGVLEEVFLEYQRAMAPEGYWGFPGETFSTGHIIEQYILAEDMGLKVPAISLRPIEFMVQQQSEDGWFDIHNNRFIGSQAHGVRALAAVLALQERQSIHSKGLQNRKH